MSLPPAKTVDVDNWTANYDFSMVRTDHNPAVGKDKVTGSVKVPAVHDHGARDATGHAPVPEPDINDDCSKLRNRTFNPAEARIIAAAAAAATAHAPDAPVHVPAGHDHDPTVKVPESGSGMDPANPNNSLPRYETPLPRTMSYQRTF